MKLWVIEFALNLLLTRWIETCATLILTGLLWLFFLWGRVELLDADGKKIPGPSNDYFNFSSDTHPVQIFRHARLNKKASTCIQTIMLPRLGDGQVCGFRAMGFPVMITNNPDVLRTVLSGKFDEFPKAERYDRLRTFLRDGLVTSQGLKWKLHRSIINKGFAAEKFNVMIQCFIDTISNKVGVWKKECAASESNAVAVDMNSQMSTLTTAIICKTAFSYTVDTSIDRNNNFGDVNLLLDEINNRLVQPTNWWHHLDPVQERKVNAEIEKTNVLIDKIIAQRLQTRSEAKKEKKEGEEKEEDPKDLLDILLDSSDECARESGTPVVITPGELRDHILTFLAAGHETTSTTMQWIMYEVCLHPEVQRNVHREIDDVLQGGRAVTKADISQNFPYVNQVIKEAMRMHPAVSNIARKNVKDTPIEYTDSFGEKKKFNLKAGTNIACSLSSLHRNPMYWNKPNVFDPERFSEANIRTTLKYSPFLYLPFSAGARNCIGQRFASLELIALFVSLMQSFRLSLSDEHLLKVRFEETVVQCPKDLWVTLTPRV